MLLKFNDKIAGPSDLAGFIEAPVNGPPTNEQTQTIPPIESPAIGLDALLSVATLIIVSIKNIVIINSKMNPCVNDNLLMVIPKLC